MDDIPDIEKGAKENNRLFYFIKVKQSRQLRNKIYYFLFKSVVILTILIFLYLYIIDILILTFNFISKKLAGLKKDNNVFEGFILSDDGSVISTADGVRYFKE